MRSPVVYRFFFFNDTATTEIYTLSLHDALPISLRAPVHACASSSPIGPRAPNRPPVRLRDVGGPPPCARRKVDEAAAPLERDVGRELDSFVHVVRRQHDHAAPPRRAATTQLAEQRPELGRRGEIEPREWLVGQQDARIVDHGLGDRRALRQTPGE